MTISKDVITSHASVSDLRPCHPGPGLHRVDGWRRRVDRHRPPPGRRSRAQAIADIDPDPFYLLNFPGSMEVAALFRPTLRIEEGLVTSLEMPTNEFYVHEAAQLLLFLGREPNLHWARFGDCVLEFAQRTGVRRALFVGSFGGAVPHTREPRLHVTCSEPGLLPEFEQYGVRRTAYEGPGSFASYLMSRGPAAGVEMVSLAAEIPGYLQGRNPVCIEAVTRRLAKILQLPLDLGALRAESTEWEVQVSEVVEKDKDLAGRYAGSRMPTTRNCSSRKMGVGVGSFSRNTVQSAMKKS